MKSTIAFICNDQLVSLDINPAITLLDVLRTNLTLTGTKEGCREGDCGACTILLGTLENNSVSYLTVNSCLLPIGDIHGKHVVTVEGLKKSGLNLVQSAMVDQGGTQCGFCTPGFVMSMTGYFINEPAPTLETAVESLDGNICRCTGYTGIKRALDEAIAGYNNIESDEPGSHIEKLITADILPDYFNDIPAKLAAISADTTTEPTNGHQPTMVGGGTDLFVQRWDTISDTHVKLLNKNLSLESVRIENSVLIIPGSTTLSTISKSDTIHEIFPHIREWLKLFGSLPIRNRATAAGNIVNASPIADFVNILIALGAKLHLTENGSEFRTIDLPDFYKGYKSLDKLPGEIIKEILVPVPEGEFLMNNEKVSKRTYLDIASVNSTIFIEASDGVIKNARISAGGVGPIPMYLKQASGFLAGKRISPELVSEVVKIARSEISPISDARGTADYKKLLLGQLLKAHLLTLFPELLSIQEVV